MVEYFENCMIDQLENNNSYICGPVGNCVDCWTKTEHLFGKEYMWKNCKP